MRRMIDLGSGPVLKVVLRLSIPTMLAQLVNVLYSIVDRMYIGAGVGDLALAGVGVCGPIVTFMASFGTLVGMGGSPNVAMRMGEGKDDEARHILWNGFVMLLALSVVLTTVFLLGRTQLLMWFGASSETFSYANTYLTIYTAGTFFALMAGGMNSFLICQGFSGLGMLTVMLDAVLNIVLDPVFIFVFDMGVAGAALASVISQAASCVWVLCALRGKNVRVRLQPSGFSWKAVGKIARFGFSPFLIIALDSVLFIALNAVLQRYGGPGEGDILVTCATIVQSYYLIISMPMSGLTSGCQPVVSYNYGAGNIPRIKQAIKTVVGLDLIFCAVVLVGTHLFSIYFVRLFTQSAEIAARTVQYNKIFTCMILPLAVQYALVDETTAVGYVRLSCFCSMFRKALFLIMVMALPAVLGTAESVFWAEPIVDLVAAVVTTTLFLRLVPQHLARRENQLRKIPS